MGQPGMTADGNGDPAGLVARLELQSKLLELLRRDLEAARLANESRDREILQTWRRLRLCEMLLEESQRERARLQEDGQRLQEDGRRLQEQRDRLSADLLHLRSTLSWRITSPLRRFPRLREVPTPPIGSGREKP